MIARVPRQSPHHSARDECDQKCRRPSHDGPDDQGGTQQAAMLACLLGDGQRMEVRGDGKPEGPERHAQ